MQNISTNSLAGSATTFFMADSVSDQVEITSIEQFASEFDQGTGRVDRNAEVPDLLLPVSFVAQDEGTPIELQVRIPSASDIPKITGQYDWKHVSQGEMKTPPAFQSIDAGQLYGARNSGNVQKFEIRKGVQAVARTLNSPITTTSAVDLMEPFTIDLSKSAAKKTLIMQPRLDAAQLEDLNTRSNGTYKYGDERSPPTAHDGSLVRVMKRESISKHQVALFNEMESVKPSEEDQRVRASSQESKKFFGVHPEGRIIGPERLDVLGHAKMIRQQSPAHQKAYTQATKNQANSSEPVHAQRTVKTPTAPHSLAAKADTTSPRLHEQEVQLHADKSTVKATAAEVARAPARIEQGAVTSSILQSSSTIGSPEVVRHPQLGTEAATTIERARRAFPVPDRPNGTMPEFGADREPYTEAKPRAEFQRSSQAGRQTVVEDFQRPSLKASRASLAPIEKNPHGAEKAPGGIPQFVSLDASSLGLPKELVSVDSLSANSLLSEMPRPVEIPIVRSVPPRPVIAQVVEAIARLPDGAVEVRLNPEELGRIRLSLVPGEGGLLVQIAAEQASTLDLIRRHIDVLQSELRASGYSGLSFSFTDGQERKEASVTDAVEDTAELDALPVENVPNAVPITSSDRNVDQRMDLRL